MRCGEREGGGGRPRPRPRGARAGRAGGAGRRTPGRLPGGCAVRSAPAGGGGGSSGGDAVPLLARRLPGSRQRPGPAPRPLPGGGGGDGRSGDAACGVPGRGCGGPCEPRSRPVAGPVGAGDAPGAPCPERPPQTRCRGPAEALAGARGSGRWLLASVGPLSKTASRPAEGGRRPVRSPPPPAGAPRRLEDTPGPGRAGQAGVLGPATAQGCRCRRCQARGEGQHAPRPSLHLPSRRPPPAGRAACLRPHAPSPSLPPSWPSWGFLPAALLPFPPASPVPAQTPPRGLPAFLLHLDASPPPAPVSPFFPCQGLLSVHSCPRNAFHRHHLGIHRCLADPLPAGLAMFSSPVPAPSSW